MTRRLLEHLQLLRLTRTWTLDTLRPVKPVKSAKSSHKKHSIRALSLVAAFLLAAPSVFAADDEKITVSPKIAVSEPAAVGSALVSKEGDENKAAEIKAADAKAAELKKSGKKERRKVGNVVIPAVSDEIMKAEGEDVSMTGIVGGRNYYGIGVASDSDGQLSREIWFNLVKGVKFQGAKSIMDFNDGDRVKVVYKELKKSKKRILKSVVLVRKAPKEPAETPDEEPANA